ncbi:PepSY domain-containing protein [Parerythrobacter lacustris]|uniref:PepSY domain-containing protein n=1 Tax=Parerythrobacter lacustris TaxID=2969984 RepID=A0ABT1XMN4_9SPHN|nr:PepSY domain-containing protein [Parerythrobacter lacustris]MCR2832924.1 PepSY domain-containing protein [Parerythrobacter lacustris]
MNRKLASILAAAALAHGFAVAPAHAQPQGDEDKARKEMRAGNVLPLREIERRVLPMMRGAEYLGPAYDSAAMAYRLKFIRDGKVMYVDVDARTGRILRRSQ